ncbi:MAG: DUF3109 family protein, partial [Pedobacter sp.]
MIEVGGTLVHEEVISESFVCNLNKCKGICCVEGDAGAPLDAEETLILQEIYPKIKHLLAPKGIIAIEEQGTSV